MLASETERLQEEYGRANTLWQNECSVKLTYDWHVGSWRHSQTRAHDEAEIGNAAVVKAKFLDVVIQILSKIDDSVFQCSIAAWRITESASLVVFTSLSIAHSKVSHVLSTTFRTHFEVCVPVKLRHILCWDATLTVETVNVLADYVLEMLLLHQLNEAHVRL